MEQVDNDRLVNGILIWEYRPVPSSELEGLLQIPNRSIIGQVSRVDDAMSDYDAFLVRLMHIHSTKVETPQYAANIDNLSGPIELYEMQQLLDNIHADGRMYAEGFQLREKTYEVAPVAGGLGKQLPPTLATQYASSGISSHLLS